MIALTARQQQVLDFLIKFQKEMQSPPTIRITMKHFGFRSTNSVAGHLDSLEKKGYITRKRFNHRGIFIRSLISGS